MAAKDSTTWFWSDWAGDQAVRRLTPAERGLWIDLLSLASAGAPVGYVTNEKGEPLPVEDIARFANCSTADCLSLVGGILEKAACSRDRSGRLYSRRMVRDAELSVKRRRAGQAGAAATALKWHGYQDLPRHLPGHVPRQAGHAPFQKESKTSTEQGSARARASVAEPSDQNQTSDTEPADEKGHQLNGAITGELNHIIQKKGWAK